MPARRKVLLADQVDARRSPALKKTGLWILRGLDVFKVCLDVDVQPRDIDLLIRRAIILQPHQTLLEQVDRTLRDATVDAQVHAGCKANQSFVEMTVVSFGISPDVFEEFVTSEVLTLIE